MTKNIIGNGGLEKRHIEKKEHVVYVTYTKKYIDDLIEVFTNENKQLPKNKWKHKDHLIVGLHYCLTESDSMDALREGIKKHNFSHNPESTGYHETRTYFWKCVLEIFIKSRPGKDIYQLANMLPDSDLMTEGDYALEYYSKSILASDEARKTIVEPDRRSFPRTV